MTAPPADRPILAITYAESGRAGEVLRRLAAGLAARGVRCAGFLQRDEPPAAGRTCCDMVLVGLASGERLKISEDRGQHARGCRLDAGELVRAVASARSDLDAGADVLVVNKFGKTEAEGGGFRPLIADAIGLGRRVLITVPSSNLAAWRAFAGDLACEVSADAVSTAEDESALLATFPEA
jgi:nucleoside-triphosphatase THEP1